MHAKKIYFLSGLPRTGSTLLGSILAQNPLIHVTPTSPLYPLLVGVNETLNTLELQYTYDFPNGSDRMYKALVSAFYADVEEDIIFDKHRGWPKHCDAISAYINPEPRIICTIRPIAEIITSYLVLADKDPDNFIDKHLRAVGRPIDNQERASLLWLEYLKTPYENLLHGLHNSPQNILLVEYRDIVFNTQKTLQRIYDFCGVSAYEHAREGIENKCAENKDEAWGMKDLHTLRDTVDYKSADPASYLVKEAIEYFNSMDVGNQ